MFRVAHIFKAKATIENIFSLPHLLLHFVFVCTEELFGKDVAMHWGARGVNGS